MNPVLEYVMPAFKGRLRFLFIAAFALLAPAVGRADTYGLPPFTTFEKEWRLNDADVQGPDVRVARTSEEWTALWKKLDPKAKDAPQVDFGRWIIVGVVTPAGQPGRAIYRVELDDAAHPKELRVRVAADGCLCQKPKNLRIKGTRVHLAAVGVSTLPTRFLLDAEVDGGLFGLNDGVDQTPLGKSPGVETPALKGKAAYREQAERLVRESLIEEDVARLRKGVRPMSLGERYPQAWSVIQVHRGVSGWEVEYDGLHFAVDAETGKVDRRTDAAEKQPETAKNEGPSPAALIRAATTPPGPGDLYPALPSLSTEMHGRVANELAGSAAIRAAYARLDQLERNVTWFEGVAALEKEKAAWCLASCLCHPSPDVQIDALHALERLGDKRPVAFIVLYAEYMAVEIAGSENATIHGVIHESAARTLSALTGVRVALKGQNAEELKRGLKLWRKWLCEQGE